jgi:ELWxxDGT repeat protein
MNNVTKLISILFLPLSNLWAQPVLLNPLNTISSHSISSEETLVNNGLYYVTARDNEHGYEVWRSDGTEAGTYMLKDINPDQSSYNSPFGFIAVGNQVFFMADDSIHGYELWVTDGSTAGTKLVLDILPGVQGSGISKFAVLHDKLYFISSHAGVGRKLWVSDGTETGTHVINIGTTEVISNNGLVAFNDHLIFTAREDYLNSEPWISDGTEAGTHQIKDIYPGNSQSLGPFSFYFTTPIGVFFTAKDGVNGEELWFTNGDSAQTRMVKNLNPSAFESGIYMFDEMENFGYANGKFYFVAHTGATNWEELWATDGTESGTYSVKTFTGNYPGLLRLITEAPQGIFFRTGDEFTGLELYFSDGTEAGTRLVKDIVPGVDGGLDLTEMHVVGDRVYFSAGQSSFEQGVEIWSSDGTEAGTQLLSDVYPGVEGSYPQALNFLNDQLMFVGTNDEVRQGLFKIQVNTVSVKETNTSNFALQITPQPASDHVRIAAEHENQTFDRLELAYPNGARVPLQTGAMHQYDLDCSQLASGLYAVLVYSGEGLTVRKMVVVR